MVRFYGDVRHTAPDRTEKLNCRMRAGDTVDTLISRLGVAPNEDGLVIGVNGVIASPDRELRDGDEVVFVTPMQGGSPNWRRRKALARQTHRGG